MSDATIPEDLLYTAEHEWAKVDGDRVTVGITAFAVEQLTDLVYMQLPAIGRQLVRPRSTRQTDCRASPRTRPSSGASSGASSATSSGSSRRRTPTRTSSRPMRSTPAFPRSLYDHRG